MKSIKNISVILSALVALTIFNSCNDEEIPYTPAEAPGATQGIFFPTTNRTVVELDPTEPTEITITISRKDSTAAADVPIKVTTNTNNVFVVPQSVSFAPLAGTSQFKVTFPTAEIGTAYQLSLSVEGDNYVDIYSAGAPYFTASVSRVKWEPFEGPIVMQFNGFWGSDAAEYYVPKAEIASYALGNTAYSIRLTNPFPTAGGEGAVPDEYGIYSGLPEIWPEEIVRDNVQMIINIDRADGKARIAQTGIGAMWYDIEMFIMLNGATSAGTVRSDAAGNIVSIDFPAESLFIVALSPNQGWRGGLQLYLSWDTYIADHMQIEDFNVLDYEDIPGAVSEFESKAYGESWNQAIAKAVDVDEENPDSEYKDLYYLPDLYAAGYGLAFYYDGTALSIPANQPIGTTAFQNKLFVSQSSSIKSSVTVSPKGVTIYTLGLQFHYADGTVVGEFAEAFYYSEDPVSYDIADFYGRFKLTGPSQFSGEEDANMNVTIAAGSEENTLIIKGITYAAEVEAVFDPGTSTMSIAPQVLADFILQGNAYDMTLYTTTPDGDISETATMDFTFNMAGELVMTPTSGADGYLINSDAAGGWVDGYYGLLFTPQAAASSAVVKSSAYNNTPLKAMKSLQRTSVVKKEKGSNGNFIIQKKASRKAVGNMVPAPVF